jgi:hypothetical protein
VREARHDLERIPQNHAVGPIDVVLVELDSLPILLLWIGEQRTLDTFARRDFENGLGRNPLVNVQSYRVNLKPCLLSLPCLFQPRLTVTQRLGQ